MQRSLFLESSSTKVGDIRRRKLIDFDEYVYTTRNEATQVVHAAMGFLVWCEDKRCEGAHTLCLSSTLPNSKYLGFESY